MHQLQQPAVFLDMTSGWPVLQWTAEHLSSCLCDKRIRFRLGTKTKDTNTPLFETQCSFVNATLGQFLSWSQGHTGTKVGPFCDFHVSEHWAYADYKYITEVFEEHPAMFEDVKWSEFGFEGRNGRESTLWIGTEGANTPCHLDSYGCNLVLQVEGRKRWHLFPPEDTSKMYPTRIPYEESSVFSQVDVLRPDLKRFPGFETARAHSVTLQPGQVLFVPRHWWHFVESVDPVTVSVNSWIELEKDDEARVSEAVTKAVVCALKTAPSEDNRDDWLNPTEEGVTSHTENMQYLNLALKAFAQKQRGLSSSWMTQHPKDSHPVKRDCTGQVLRHDLSVPLTVPFGPHLTPVHCQQGHSPQPDTRGMTIEEPEVDSCRKCSVRSQQSCAAENSETRQKTDPVWGIHRGEGECGSALSCSGVCEEGLTEDNEDSVHATVTTNDLLDCLVHPDIVTRVTRLLLERHIGRQKTAQS